MPMSSGMPLPRFSESSASGIYVDVTNWPDENSHFIKYFFEKLEAVLESQQLQFQRFLRNLFAGAMEKDTLQNFTSFKSTVVGGLPLRRDGDDRPIAIVTDVLKFPAATEIDGQYYVRVTSDEGTKPIPVVIDTDKPISVTFEQPIEVNALTPLPVNLTNTAQVINMPGTSLKVESDSPLKVDVTNDVRIDQPVDVNVLGTVRTHIDNDKIEVHWKDQEVKVRNPVSDEDLIPIPLFTAGVDIDLKPEWNFRHSKVDVVDWHASQEVKVDGKVEIDHQPVQVTVPMSSPIPVTGSVSVNNQVTVTGAVEVFTDQDYPLAVTTPQGIDVNVVNTPSVTVDSLPDITVVSMPAVTISGQPIAVNVMNDVKVDATTPIPVTTGTVPVQVTNPVSLTLGTSVGINNTNASPVPISIAKYDANSMSNMPLPVEIFFAPNATYGDRLGSTPQSMAIYDSSGNWLDQPYFVRSSWRNPFPNILTTYAGKTEGNNADHNRWWNGLTPNWSGSNSARYEELYFISADVGNNHSNKLNVST